MLVLVSVSGGLLGYVVTNYGTLFRLRLFVVAPVWMLALACGLRKDASAVAPAALGEHSMRAAAEARG